jgi:hypothetical protein
MLYRSGSTMAAVRELACPESGRDCIIAPGITIAVRVHAYISGIADAERLELGRLVL